jgi:vacuolar iron transporter family protein
MPTHPMPRRAQRRRIQPSTHANGAARSNWLRADVLGANDGIVSVAGLDVGVAAVTTDRGPMLAAGSAGLVAGAVALALGEYVSVSTQRDTEKALLAMERRELAETRPKNSTTRLRGSVRPPPVRWRKS